MDLDHRGSPEAKPQLKRFQKGLMFRLNKFGWIFMQLEMMVGCFKVTHRVIITLFFKYK